MCNVSTTDEVTAGALPASVLELLAAWGFPVAPHRKAHPDLAAVQAAIP